MERRGVNFPFLPRLSDPGLGGPGASDGEDLKEGRAQARSVPPAAGSRKAGRRERADAHACGGDGGGDGDGDGVVAPEPPWSFSQKPKTHSYRSLHLPVS